MFITLDQFKQCFPHCKSPTEWYNALQEVLPLNNINTKNREICFLAQCGHESGEFNILRENFNYSADGLLKIFPKYFTAEQAKQYARQPEKIANKVYANRMGNGDEASGDGFKYRGIGLIQLTGKDNITRCSMDIFKDDRLVVNPEILADSIYSIIAACWFWNKNNLNILADKLDMTALTKKINGGTIGLQERIKLLAKIQSIVK
jgi:putative chitinase